MCGAENSRMINLAIVKNQFWFTMLILIAGWGGYWIFRNYLPQYNSPWYPVIPAFFFLYGFNFIRLFIKKTKEEVKKQLIFLLASKVVKFSLSVIIVVLYYVLVSEKQTAFLLTFIIFYMVCLLYETGLFYFYERKLKKNKVV